MPPETADTGFVVPTEKCLFYKAKPMTKRAPCSEDLIGRVTEVHFPGAPAARPLLKHSSEKTAAEDPCGEETLPSAGTTAKRSS